VRSEAAILRADARRLPLADGSVDLIVTSPPYFGLRSYTDGGVHYDGQIGSEATPAEYIANLIDCTREWVRVLKPQGSLFVNLGDKYDAGTGSPRRVPGDLNWIRKASSPRSTVSHPKSLLGLPWRYALACIDQLGLILRAEIIWAKPNGLPESVTDRVRRAHEQVFHFTRQPRYYTAIDEIREPHNPNTHARGPGGAMARDGQSLPTWGTNGTQSLRGSDKRYLQDPLGKLPGSVWSIPSAPLAVPPRLGVDHFAAFPPALVRPVVLGWSPRTVCADCGFLLGSSYDSGMLGVRDRVHTSRKARPRSPVLLEGVRQQGNGAEQDIDQIPPPDDSRLRGTLEARSPDGEQGRVPDGASAGDGRAHRQDAGAGRGCASPQQREDRQPDREPGAAGQGRSRPLAQATSAAIRMSSLRRPYPHRRDPEHSCPHCGSDQLRPSVIADPFGGTGTTALVATVHGRHAISADLSADYCRLAQWRVNDPGERARALDVPKPPPIPDGMEPLFAL
jgi:DNA modification methylase